MGKRIILCAAVLVIAIVASVSAAVPTQAPRTCFPASKWSDQQRFRPCVSVERVYEDGSFTFSVEDADGVQRFDGAIGALDN